MFQVVLLELFYCLLHPGLEGGGAIVDQQYADSIVHQVFLSVILFVDLLGTSTNLFEVVLLDPGSSQETGQIKDLLEFPFEGLMSCK